MALRHGLIEAAESLFEDTLSAALSVALRHGLIEAPVGVRRVTVISSLSVALRHGLIEARGLLYKRNYLFCYPWHYATASLKLHRGGLVNEGERLLSVALRHGLIEANIAALPVLPLPMVIRGITPRPH